MLSIWLTCPARLKITSLLRTRLSMELVSLTSDLFTVKRSSMSEILEWPPEKKAIDIGDFYADCSKLTRTVGWQPTTFLDEGLARTVAFYRNHLAHYVSDVS